MDSNYLKFKGFRSLVGDDSFEKIKSSSVLIIGLGGVGSWSAEALARSGVGTIGLVDLDDICVSNTNRQIHAVNENYGKFKVDALCERILSINPECNIIKHHCFYNEKNSEKIFSHKYTVVIDAMDSVNDKCFLIDYCYKNSLPVILGGGAGGKIDPRKIEIAELEKTKNDMLLKSVRKKLRKEYHYPVGRGKAKIQCVYSSELGKAFEVCDISNSTKKLDCEGALGSAAHITGIFGLMISGLALEHCQK